MQTANSSTHHSNGNLNLLGRVYQLAKPYKAKLYTAIALTIGMAFLGPLRPFIIQYTIDNFIANNNQIGLINMSLLLLFMLILQAGMQVWSTILTNYLGQSVIKDLRMQVFTYLTGLRLLFYDKTPVGALVTRTISDIETIADVFSEGLINISGDILQIVFILIFMFGTNWQLSLVSLSVLPFLLYAGYVFKEKVRLSFEDVRTQVSRLNTFVQEHIQAPLHTSTSSEAGGLAPPGVIVAMRVSPRPKVDKKAGAAGCTRGDSSSAFGGVGGAPNPPSPALPGVKVVRSVSEKVWKSETFGSSCSAVVIAAIKSTFDEPASARYDFSSPADLVERLLNLSRYDWSIDDGR